MSMNHLLGSGWIFETMICLMRLRSARSNQNYERHDSSLSWKVCFVHQPALQSCLVGISQTITNYSS